MDRNKSCKIPRTALGILADQGVSLRQAAKKIGLSPGHLSQCLNPDKPRRLSDHHAILLHQHFSIPLDLLVALTPESFVDQTRKEK